LIGVKRLRRPVPTIDSMARHGRVDRVAIMDILISLGKWLALTAGALILFGAVIVGLLAWLLNRPVD
jgi:hypothetical protein